MPTYILLVKLTDQGSKDIHNAPARVEEAINLYQKMGGKVIGAYLVMGEYDYIAVGECPSDEIAVSYSLALSAQGNVKTTTLKAFPPKELQSIIRNLPKS